MAVKDWISLGVLVALAMPFPVSGKEDSSVSVEFVSKKADDSASTEKDSSIEGPEIDESEEPQPPAALEPIPDALPPAKKETAPPQPAPAKPKPTATPTPKKIPPAAAPPPIEIPKLLPDRPAPSPRTSEPLEAVSMPGPQIEYQPAGKEYTPSQNQKATLQPGERLRWKYSQDEEWRILEAYAQTEVKLLDHHYEISGNFFHSFRDGNNRIQVPTIAEARDRRDHPEGLDAVRANLRLFVEVDQAAPKAPAPEGNCLVWQKGKLWLNDLAAGEVDSVIPNAKGAVDHLEITSLIPGVIFVLTPPSQIFVYAVKVDFEGEIFKVIGREKGRADASIEKLAKLLQLADTPEKRTWCEGRMAYEQEQSNLQSQKQMLYESFLQGNLDALGVIRSGQPLPHIQMAKAVYRHENLELSAGLFSDHLGKCIVPANAFLWINESIPTPNTPFTLEVLDQSDPAFVGFDTHFRTEGEKLIAEERYKGSTAWVPRDVVIDIYHYATFRPPQPEGPPVYLLDVTMDITGGLKRLNKEQPASARVGTVQLTPDVFRIEITPQLLTGSGPMEKIVREILLQPLSLRAWYAGRRVHIRDAFEMIPILPDELMNEIEEAADELGMRVYEFEKPKRAANPTYAFEPFRIGIELARTITPGQMHLDITLENEAGDKVQVVREVFPKVDVLDYAARAVAVNRTNARLSEFHPLTLSEWIESRKPRTLMSK
jgi:hypothetical protein